jgi:hypothetical protein
MSTPPEAFTLPPAEGATGDVMQAYSRIWRHVQAALPTAAWINPPKLLAAVPASEDVRQ